MTKFTPEYIEAEKIFKAAELKFKNNPCTKTATKLSNARVKMNSVEKHTKEFLSYCDACVIADMKDTLSMPSPYLAYKK